MTNRLNLENNYRDALKRNKEVSLGEKFVKYIGKQIILPAITDVAKSRVKNYLNSGLNKVEKETKKQVSKQSNKGNK